MTTLTSTMDWTHLWDDAGLPRPPLPARLAGALRPLDDSAFATPGWPAALDIGQAMRLWLGEPERERAWVGVAGHGLQSTAVRVFMCGPHSGLFVQRIWSRLPSERTPACAASRAPWACSGNFCRPRSACWLPGAGPNSGACCCATTTLARPAGAGCPMAWPLCSPWRTTRWPIPASSRA